ncbi:MAG: hypothetical protein L0Y80_12890 [Ignavibacteriae bacterium]|nr:hypothetical protein [Ignavibacteriota bacterium]
MLTALAILFVLLLVGSIFYGFSIVMRKPPTEEELRTEKCSLCGNRFPKEELVERPVGDYKVYYFCQQCVGGLYRDMQEKDVASGVDTKRLIAEAREKKN